MEHFSREIYLAYQRDALKREDRWALEDHLAQCDQCLSTYLQIVEQGMEAGQPEPSPGFTQGVLKSLGLSKGGKSKEISRRQLLKYYTVAASITLILVATGFFQGIEGQFSQAAEELVRPETGIETQFQGSLADRLMDSTFRLKEKIMKQLRSDDVHE